MILSDRAIKKAMSEGGIEISPFDSKLLNPNSYDLRLASDGFCEVTVHPPDTDWVIWECTVDPLDKSTYRNRVFKADTVTIPPGGFLLGTVIETLRLGNGYVAELTGKSSLARLGLAIHITAGLGDTGWEGRYVLEFVNHAPYNIKLTAGMPIAQLILQRSEEVDIMYGDKLTSKYQNQKPGQGSLYHKNVVETKNDSIARTRSKNTKSKESNDPS